jgi:hypothetical protein
MTVHPGYSSWGKSLQSQKKTNKDKLGFNEFLGGAFLTFASVQV